MYALQLKTIKERPILFSGPMVKAILEDRKTQTRRVITTQQPMTGEGFKLYRAGENEWFYQRGDMQWGIFKNPYGVPSDHLWVRETWAQDLAGELFFAADYKAKPSTVEKWKSARFMPRRAARVTLELVNVRAERLQDISEEDARAEGVRATLAALGSNGYRAWFSALWDSINSKRGYSWDSNPWVWVLEFKRIDRKEVVPDVQLTKQ